MKSQGKKLKTWDDFCKAMIAMSLFHLHKEVAEITQCKDIYAEVRAMRMTTMGLTPAMAHTNLQPYRASLAAGPQTPAPTRQRPPQYSALTPKYQPVPTMPRTPTPNKQQYAVMPGRSTPSAPQATLGTNRNLFIPLATGTNAIPIRVATGQTNDQFANWDRRQPYPKTAEGKAAYEAALQAWWDRNRFNGRPTAADLLPLMLGTLPAGSRECYACGQNDINDAHFPYIASMCPITPKVPLQESNWWANYTLRMRPPVTPTMQPSEVQIQQVEEYMTYPQETMMLDTNPGNGRELSM